MNDVDVLIAGAGPVGLTAAIELRRRGVRVRIVDPLPDPPQYAKAVGVQPRTLEVFEGMGVIEQILDAGMEMRGQLVYVNGEQVSRVDLMTPPDVPYRFHLLPQYATERVLRERLTDFGTVIERGTRVSGFEQDDDGVTVTLSGYAGDVTVRAGYLVGADGAHSVVRKGLGLSFEGGAFDEQYMLGDVAVDWSMPRGYAVRAMHQAADGTTDDLLVCIPLPGRSRYRLSTLVPDELAVAPATGGDGVAHGFEGDRPPQLSHIQAVVDRMAPEPSTVSDLRWSSVFRISHRIVDSYGRGRVFVAGDAAHIHPPTGAQGMNTGVQDAHNLAWKLALAVAGDASAALLESYDLERRPVGEEVVGRTVRDAREGVGSDSTDMEFVMRREAQLLISYAGSPVVAGSATPSRQSAPRAGERAPDAAGLSRESVNHPLRLFTLLGGVDHSLILYADATASTEDVAVLESLADEITAMSHDHVDVHVIAAPTAQVGSTVLPLLRDTEGLFAAGYLPDGSSVFVVRPDGYLGYRGPTTDTKAALAYLEGTFR
ncbi:pentachlorophenol monooxygenase [Gordonia jinghuaiqii]|uniref:FAD-dependent monooxygenase n=1 Tax=Gordonia jinghuaiqii TaxID=2758710 RepID=A0A7D7LPB0_9ACTN|nr:FAD-dependent monooxygenase [Gordonia jinghuaiqii]MCR5976794.1 pentachlorophenol monooxygenase [Gordonia jinghuaiqii]QMS99964.1 FAD-dependent monooxygenase [Gordonia jinghuaiqii]